MEVSALSVFIVFRISNNTRFNNPSLHILWEDWPVWRFVGSFGSRAELKVFSEVRGGGGGGEGGGLRMSFS